MLRPQDILMSLKLVLSGRDWTYDQIARELGLSSSAVHRSVERIAEAGLYRPESREVNRAGLAEFLVHGVRYVFPADWGGEDRGVPTAWAAEPLAKKLSSSGKNPPVWPDPHGSVFGIALIPLDPRVPEAARRDEPLGELLALVDAIRIASILGFENRWQGQSALESRFRGRDHPGRPQARFEVVVRPRVESIVAASARM